MFLYPSIYHPLPNSISVDQGGFSTNNTELSRLYRFNQVAKIVTNVVDMINMPGKLRRKISICQTQKQR